MSALQTRKEELMLMSMIANRALDKHPEIGPKMSLVMDLEFVHERHGLRLQEFLNAPDGDFFHDALGIYKHLDRSAKVLKNCFVPRFSL